MSTTEPSDGSGRGRVRRLPKRLGLMSLVAVAAAVTLSTAACTPAPVAATMPGIWRHQTNVNGAIYTEEWVVDRSGVYTASLSGPGVFTRNVGTWEANDSIGRFRLNQPYDYYPTQACGPLGCTPIARPPGESFTVTVLNNNAITTESYTSGAKVTWLRVA